MVARIPVSCSPSPPPEEPLRLATGWRDLDILLAGGWPAGRLTEIRGQGRSSLALAAVRVAQEHGVPVAWVDGSGSFCPVTAAVDLEALALVRPGVGREGRGHHAPRGLASRAHFAADVLLRSRAFGLVVLDTPSTRSSMATWFRLARMAERSRAVLILLTGAPRVVAGSAAGLVLDVCLLPASAPHWAELPEPALSVSVRRHRDTPESGPRRVILG